MKEIRQSETVIIKRSQINFAPYNPKRHSKEAIAQQKRNFEKVGFLGGLVWNAVTGNLISGHKRIMAFDLHYKYDGTPETDYDVKVEKVELDPKTEKEQNIYMDAQSTNTPQDYDLLAELIPDIDYKNAGLTDEDLQLIGVDFSVQTEDERGLADDIDELTAPIKAEKERTKEEKRADIKAKKEKVLQEADNKVADMNSYVVLNFENYKNKSQFMLRFGFPASEKFIKGELFSEMIERVE